MPPKDVTSKYDAIKQMQQLIDRMDEIQLPPDYKEIADLAFYQENSQIAESLFHEMQSLLETSSDKIKNHIDAAPDRSRDAAHFRNRQELWEMLVRTISQAEQVLWYLADASWLSRVDARNSVIEKGHPCEDLVEIHALPEEAFIRMPLLGSGDQYQFQLPEKLLLGKLSRERSLPTFESCHATFTHIYPTAVKSLPKDPTNMDYRKCIDILAAMFRFSDAAGSFTMTVRGGFTDTLLPGTYIHLKNAKKLDFHTIWNVEDSEVP